MLGSVGRGAPWTMPMFSLMTLIGGAMQLVVHDAAVTICARDQPMHTFLPSAAKSCREKNSKPHQRW